jgi:hypothetical protein
MQQILRNCITWVRYSAATIFCHHTLHGFGGHPPFLLTSDYKGLSCCSPELYPHPHKHIHIEIEEGHSNVIVCQLSICHVIHTKVVEGNNDSQYNASYTVITLEEEVPENASCY